jgi:hypothetical protein
VRSAQLLTLWQYNKYLLNASPYGLTFDGRVEIAGLRRDFLSGAALWVTPVSSRACSARSRRWLSS